MLEWSKIRETKVYQEAFQEGKKRGEQKAKLKLIPGMVNYGLSPEVIAYFLDIPVEMVTEALENLDRDDQS